MKNLLLFLSLSFFCSLHLSAQDTTWFNSDWIECTRAKAMYYHLEYTEGNLTDYKDYYLSNNQVQNTGQYLDGKEQGNFVWFHENGQKASEVNYVQGMREGIYTAWHPNGAVAEEGQYRAGQQTGAWKYYNEEGELMQPIEIGESFDIDVITEPTLVEDDEKDPDPNSFIMIEKEPRPLNMGEVRAAIGYPPLAKEAQLEGIVTVRVLIGKTGQYERHITLRRAHPILHKAVEDHISMLKFSPALMAGKPVKLWLTIPFDFRMVMPEEGEE